MTAANIKQIREIAEQAFDARYSPVGDYEKPDMTRAQWDIAFEAGFMRALTVLGLGSAKLTPMQMQSIAVRYMAASGEDYAKDPEALPHTWVIQAMNAVAMIYDSADTSDALFSVVEKAIERGEVPTVTLKPLEPLAMGNYQIVIDVRARSANTPAGHYWLHHKVVDETPGPELSDIEHPEQHARPDEPREQGEFEKRNGRSKGMTRDMSQGHFDPPVPDFVYCTHFEDGTEQWDDGVRRVWVPNS